MMQAIATDPRTGRKLLIVGLSEGNLAKLGAHNGTLDNYIEIRGAALGLALDVVICSGRDEAAIAQAFAEFIGPATRVHVDPTLKS